MSYNNVQASRKEEMLVTFRNTPGRIEDVRHYRDPELSALSHKACRRFVNAGPIFRNHAGQAVAYEDLDYDLQCGLLTYYVFPMDSEEAREAFERSLQTEKKEEERRRKEWSKERERERIRLKAIMKARVEDVELEDAEEEREVPGSAATSGKSGGPADKSSPVLHSRSQQPIAVSGPAGESAGRSRPAVYERLIWEDERKTQIRRRQPGVECWWHPSKTRSAERMQKIKDLGLDVFTPYARDVKRRQQLELQERWETHIVVRSQVERVLE